MNPDAIRLAAVAAVCLAVGVGFAESRSLLQPGRSERAGISLGPRVSGPRGSADGDWFYDPRTAHVAIGSQSFRVVARRRGIQLLSRQLPVFPGRCYLVRGWITSTNDISLAVMSADGSTILRRWQIEASQTLESVSLPLRPREARLSLALLASRRGVSLVVRDVALEPVEC